MVDELVKFLKKKILKKKRNRKNQFSDKNFEKCWNTKITLKKLLGVFIKDFWAIYVFFKSVQCLKQCTYEENGIKINTEFSDRLT